MAAHTIDGPGEPDDPWVTTEVAAKFCGVGKSTFERLIGKRKSPITLAGVAEWMFPNPHSKEDLWNAVDVGVVRRIMLARRNAPAAVGKQQQARPPDDDEDEETEGKS